MTGLFSILAGAVGGAVIGFFGNYLLERVKRRTALNDASRKAYASWFTAEALTFRRMDVVCKKLVEVGRDYQKYETLMLEMRSLIDDWHAMITAMNEAFLTERSPALRCKLSLLNKMFVLVIGTLESAAQRCAEKQGFHETFKALTADMLAHLPETRREEILSIKDRFNKHDADFTSPTFRSDLTARVEEMHKRAEELRNTLANTLSR